MVTVTSEVLPTGSGHDHWNSLELGSMHICCCESYQASSLCIQPHPGLRLLTLDTWSHFSVQCPIVS